MEDPGFYSQSPSFALFPNNTMYLPMDTNPTTPPRQRHQPPRSMLCGSLGSFTIPPFSLANSPASSTTSASLSNSDTSPPESPADSVHREDNTHVFGYGHDIFDHQLRAMFIPSDGNLSYPGGNAPEMNQHYIIKQDNHQAALYDSYQPYLESCSESISPYSATHLPRATDDSSEHFSSNSATLGYGFSGQYPGHSSRPTYAAHLKPNDGGILGDPNADYMLSTTAHAQYTADTSHTSIAQQQHAPLSPRFLQLSPSPPLFASPDTDGAQACDPRFVSGREDSDDNYLLNIVSKVETDESHSEQRSVHSINSAVASPLQMYDGDHDSDEEKQEYDDGEDRDEEYKDSGESEVERDQDNDNDDDGEFMLRPNRRSISRQKTRVRRSTISELSATSFSSSSTSMNTLDIQQTRAMALKRSRDVSAPVPVPNLTKKSRGRRVPTVSTIISQGGIHKNSRMYTCKVKECGKCFARGEHLKRHVRSIHTNEKPHKCPFPGCGKDFSRHDNLGQHMRVHKNYLSTRELAY